MHFHLPKPLHGWREFAGEVGIIVIGVLIALGAEQIVRDFEAQRRAAQAETRIRDELGGAIGHELERLAVTACLQSRISELARGLTSDRKDWSQFVLPPSKVAPLTLREVYHSPSRNWVEDSYHEALAQGDLDRANPAERASLAGIYKQVDELSELNRREHELSTQLAVLQFNPVLSNIERNQMLSMVAELDRINGLMSVVSSQSIDSYHHLGWQESPGDIRQDQLGWNQQVTDLHGKYGACVDRKAATLFDRRLH